jgi:hypothetical protein
LALGGIQPLLFVMMVVNTWAVDNTEPLEELKYCWLLIFDLYEII